MRPRTLNRLHNEPVPTVQKRGRYCGFCKSGAVYIDHKNPQFLLFFLNPEGRILAARYTGNCKKHQGRLASAIKRSRQLAYLPYVASNLK